MSRHTSLPQSRPVPPWRPCAMGRTPLWEQLGLAYDSRAAGIVAIAENEAEINPGKPVLSGEAVLHLIEALRATERRLTVERVREIASRRVFARSNLSTINSILDSILLDDLATADAKEEGTDGT